MKFGVCGGPEIARIAKAAGYDYFEWSVGDYLRPRDDEASFQQSLAQVQAVGLPCPASNVFIPGDLKITGQQVNLDALRDFVNIAFRRAGLAGVERIVFGSGAARQVPEGYDRQHAWQQLVAFCRMLGPLAEQHGVTVVIEPLNRTETNIINTVDEGAQLVHQVAHSNICLLADGYHWAKDGDTLEGILDNASILRHAHVATVDGRRPPHPGDDCAPFFAALKRAGYDGRVSIEGNIQDPENELPAALEIMRALAE